MPTKPKAPLLECAANQTPDKLWFIDG
jgi:hypothetical protein